MTSAIFFTQSQRNISHCLTCWPEYSISKDENKGTVVIKQMVSQTQKHACLSHLLTNACLPGIVWNQRGGYSIRQTGSQAAQVGPDVDCVCLFNICHSKLICCVCQKLEVRNFVDDDVILPLVATESELLKGVKYSRITVAASQIGGMLFKKEWNTRQFKSPGSISKSSGLPFCLDI